MRNKFIITTIVLGLILFYGTYTVYAQGFSTILKKLDEIETRLDQLEGVQKSDIENLQKQLSEIEPEQDVSVLSNSITDLQSQMDILNSMVNTLADNLEQVEAEAERAGKEEIIEPLAMNLRDLIAELRETIINPPEPEEGETEFELEITGFFDVHADRLKETENIFGLGPFELDLEAPFNENISGSAAMVFEDGVAEIGVGFIDLHFFELSASPTSPRGRIFTDPGYHMQIGQFDIPFGLEYLYYATPDRLNISAPPTTELIFDGGWTDIGIRVIKAHPLYNMTAYLVNGSESGYAGGGRFGIRPFENPFSAHEIREVPVFEFGLSGVYDMDADSKKEFSIWGTDLEVNISNLQVISEYVYSNNAQDDIEQHSYYTQFQYSIQPVELNAFGRYDEFREKSKDADDESLTNRITVGLSKELYGVSIVKFEYHYYPERDNKLSEHNEVISTQLVITF